MSHNNRRPTRPSFGPGKPRRGSRVVDSVEELNGGKWYRVPIHCGSCAQSFRSTKCQHTGCSVNRELNEARRRASGEGW